MSSDSEPEGSDSEVSDSSIGEDYTIRYGPLRYVNFAHGLHSPIVYYFEAEFIASIPSPTVKVKVKDGATFDISEDVLVEDSEYFFRALLGRPGKGPVDSIDLDDISSRDFGLYVSVMYPLVLCKTELNLQQVWPLDPDGGPAHHPWSLLLLLWKLGVRFLNENVKSIAKDELSAKLKEYSASNWNRMYKQRSEASLKAKMLRLQNAFRYCRDNGIPFEKSFVKAASRASLQVFEACVADLDDEVFRSEVTKAFALRFADQESTAKKRRREETKENEHREKKQKIENWISQALSGQFP
ncbi:hypothetical protein SLS64_005202 [Diaporthe eres]|uniref:BTB domain-containing protein n=1 Tax=Diaporthe eres TaxID=83184 RepID=A0ABR1P2Y8_DIAER